MEYMLLNPNPLTNKIISFIFRYELLDPAHRHQIVFWHHVTILCRQEEIFWDKIKNIQENCLEIGVDV